jgi:hypoxanthine phosphoribosyltransferase
MYDVSWNEFENLAIELAKKIIDSDKSFTAVIAVSRGGLLLARLLSSMLELPMGVISAKHIHNKYIIDDYISSIYDIEGDILVVDDVLEESSREICVKISKNYKQVNKIALACIFYKKNKINFEPEFAISEIKNMLTIVFPYQEANINKSLDCILD